MDKTKSSERGGPPTKFDRGVAVVPTDKLIAWLDAQKLDGSPRLLQVPVVLTRATEFSLSKVQIGGLPGALVVYANDGALGIGLKDRAQCACEGGQDACGFWVEAYWRGKQHLGYQLDVMSIQGPIDVLATADHVSVEAETGN